MLTPSPEGVPCGSCCDIALSPTQALLFLMPPGRSPLLVLLLQLKALLKALPMLLLTNSEMRRYVQ